MGQHRSIPRLKLVVRDEEITLTREIVALASTYGRYGLDILLVNYLGLFRCSRQNGNHIFTHM